MEQASPAADLKERWLREPVDLISPGRNKGVESFPRPLGRWNSRLCISEIVRVGRGHKSMGVLLLVATSPRLPSTREAEVPVVPPYSLLRVRSRC